MALTHDQLEHAVDALCGDDKFYERFHELGPSASTGRIRDLIKVHANRVLGWSDNTSTARERESIRVSIDRGYNYVRSDITPLPAQSGASSSFQSTQSTQEFTMNQPLISTKTLINGRDAATLSNSDIYSAIAAAEGKIKTLSAIENKPQALLKEIDGIKAEIAALVAFVDAKDAAA